VIRYWGLFIAVGLLSSAAWAGDHRAYLTTTWVSGHAETREPGAKYEYQQDGWAFSAQAYMGGVFQIAIVRRFGVGPVTVGIGPSYILGQKLEQVQCSQINVRTSLALLEKLPYRSSAIVEHDSNGSVCAPNPGFNTVGLGFKLN